MTRASESAELSAAEAALADLDPAALSAPEADGPGPPETDHLSVRS